MQWIINADDFGKNEKVNQSVIQCLQDGLCSSATVMANGEAFEGACQAFLNLQIDPCIGIHINLTEGEPLTERMRMNPAFCTEGLFKKTNYKKLAFSYNRENSIALFEEVCAQIDYSRNTGLIITHADSHNHAHLHWAIMPAFIAAIKEKGIRIVRQPPIDGYSGVERAYFKMCTRRLKPYIRTDRFIEIQDQKSVANCFFLSDNAIIEIGCHPATQDIKFLASGIEKRDMVSFWGI